MNRLQRWRQRRRLEAEFRTVWAMRYGRRWFGWDLRKTTRMRSGRLYPTLTRLERQGLVRSGWEDAPTGPLPRRWYELTPEGRLQVEVRVLPS